MSHLEQTSRFNFMRKIIREYYKLKLLEEPSDLHKREIALESLEDGAYIRHLAFPYMKLLYDYITTVKTPLHLYYSSALYAAPDAERMENKVWEGSELIFDIDADKFEGCSQEIWICPNSGDLYTQRIEHCPKGEKPVVYNPLPWNCLVRAWNSVMRLVEVLQEDLGYKRIKIYFSGNRGFHVKVLDTSILQLDRESRRAIADYISCEGLLFEKVFPLFNERAVFSRPEFGLRKRVLDVASQHGIVERREIKGSKNLELVELDKLKSILNEVCINIDKAVTMDISRLSRFGNSLNMKAGLLVKELDLNTNIVSLGYSSFSPFKGSIKIKPLITSRMQILDNQLDLIRNSVFKSEAYIGVYLVTKGLAIPIDVSELEVKL